MAKVKIIVDTAADMSEEMIKKYDFRVLVYDGVACYDTDSIFDDMSEVEFDKWSVNVNDVYEGNKKDSLHGCYNAN